MANPVPLDGRMVRKAQSRVAPAPQQGHGFFEGVRAVFVEGGVLSKRLEIWKKRLIGLGGTVLEPGNRIPRDATHVLAADAERLIKQYDKGQVEESTLFLVSFSWLEESLAQGKLLPPNAYRVFSSSRSASGTRSPSRSRSASPDTAQSRGGSLVESPRPSTTPPAPKTPAGSGQKRLREAEESAHETAEGLADEVAEDNKKLGLVPGGGVKETRVQREEDGADKGGGEPERNDQSFDEWGEVGREVAAEKQDMGVVSLGRTAEAIGREIVKFGGGLVEAQPAHSGGGSEEEREILSRLAKRRRVDEADSGAGPRVNTGTGLVVVNEEGFLDLRENQTPAGMANPDLNRPLLKVLGELKDIYRDAFGDDRRSFSYYKAISIIENLSFKVTSSEQLKGLPSIGKSLLDVVKDILGTGTAPRLEALKNDPMVRTLFEFGSVWGIGPVTARKLYDMGYRTLEELEREPSLTSAQRTGVKFFYDIQQRIPRHEAAEMEALVQQAAKELCPGIEVVCGGSYRRGKATCGDMDMVITHQDGRSHKGLLPKLVAQLKEMDFLTEDLLVGPSHSAEETDHGVDTYFGLCKYPGRELRHRIDFKVYPRDQHAFGLLAWTGNDVLNRRLRLIASAQGYHLNDHGLYPAIYREGDSVHNVSRGSESVPCRTESDIFRFLRVKYLEPKERNL